LLAPGASSSGSTQVILPAVAAGAYYIIAQADGTNAVFESNESDNSSLQRINIDVALPDLSVGSLVISPSNPVSTSPTTVTVTTTNGGEATAGASATRLYRSRNANADSRDILLGEFPIASLSKGGANTASIEVVLPAGQYYLVAVADASEVVTESSERNNAASIRVRIR
jgi:subtilase family serine protease